MCQDCWGPQWLLEVHGEQFDVYHDALDYCQDVFDGYYDEFGLHGEPREFHDALGVQSEVADHVLDLHRDDPDGAQVQHDLPCDEMDDALAWYGEFGLADDALWETKNQIFDYIYIYIYFMTLLC